MAIVSGPTPKWVRAELTSRRRATSLIELLVVIFVIAVLFAILIPSLKRSMSMARETVCKQNLRQIGQGLDMYRFDHRGWLPVSKAVPGSQTAASVPRTVWFLRLHPTYIFDLAVFSCPDDPFRQRLLRARDHVKDPQLADYASFGINGFIMSAGDGALANWERYRPSRPVDTILVADLGPDTATAPSVPVGDEQPSGPPGPSRNRSLLTVDDGYADLLGIGSPWVTTRHGDGINVLTLTGGVRHARTKEAMSNPVLSFYEDCNEGYCTLCRELSVHHYSFARNGLYWWTGAAPKVLVPEGGS